MVWYAVEGMDGSGKSTVAEIIRREMEAKGRKVLFIQHPSESPKGRKAYRYLHGKGSKKDKILATFYYILDVLNSLKYKRKHRGEYDDVIFVRYSMAAAYLPKSLLKMGYKVIEFVLPVPDVKILVDILPEVALERIRSRGEDLEIFESLEELTKTREKMLIISDSWIIIDNNQSPEETERGVLWVLSETERTD